MAVKGESVSLCFRAKAEFPELVRTECALVSHVMNRKNRPRIAPVRVPAALRGQLDGRKTAMPVVQMDDVRRRADMPEQDERGVVEKGKTLVVLGVSVDGIAVKVRGRVDQKGRRAVGFAVKGFGVIGPPAPVDRQVVDGRIPEILALGLEVAGSDQHRVDTDLLEGLRQRPGDVTQTTRFRIWDRFRGQYGYSHV